MQLKVNSTNLYTFTRRELFRVGHHCNVDENVKRSKEREQLKKKQCVHSAKSETVRICGGHKCGNQ